MRKRRKYEILIYKSRSRKERRVFMLHISVKGSHGVINHKFKVRPVGMIV